MRKKDFIFWLKGFLSVPYLRDLQESDEHYVEFKIIKEVLNSVLFSSKWIRILIWLLDL